MIAATRRSTASLHVAAALCPPARSAQRISSAAQTTSRRRPPPSRPLHHIASHVASAGQQCALIGVKPTRSCERGAGAAASEKLMSGAARRVAALSGCACIDVKALARGCRCLRFCCALVLKSAVAASATASVRREITLAPAAARRAAQRATRRVAPFALLR